MIYEVEETYVTKTMEASGVPAYIFMLGTLTLPENVEEKLHGGEHN